MRKTEPCTGRPGPGRRGRSAEKMTSDSERCCELGRMWSRGQHAGAGGRVCRVGGRLSQSQRSPWGAAPQRRDEPAEQKAAQYGWSPENEGTVGTEGD